MTDTDGRPGPSGVRPLALRICWLVGVLALVPVTKVVGAAEPGRPLLASCYHGGRLASWGVYEWQPGRGAFKLLCPGGRHPVWLSNELGWACYQNGNALIRLPNGAERHLLADELVDARRWIQPLDGGHATLLTTSGPFTSVADVDLAAWCRAAPDALMPAQVTKVPDLEPWLEPAAGWRLWDQATVPGCDEVLLSAMLAPTGFGPQRTRLGLWNWKTGVVRPLVQDSDRWLDGRAEWLQPGRSILVERYDRARSVRSVVRVDTATGAVTSFLPLGARRRTRGVRLVAGVCTARSGGACLHCAGW